MNSYDSKDEKSFHEKFPHLRRNESTSFPLVLEDGSPYNSTPDFYCPLLNMIIEFKSHQLNNVVSLSTSLAKQEQELEYKGYVSSYFKLKSGFNHSICKQGLTADYVASKTKHKFSIIFKDDTKLSTQSKNKMSLNNIPWLYESQYYEQLLKILPSMGIEYRRIKKRYDKLERENTLLKAAA